MLHPILPFLPLPVLPSSRASHWISDEQQHQQQLPPPNDGPLEVVPDSTAFEAMSALRNVRDDRSTGVTPTSTRFIATGEGVADEFFRCREEFRSRRKPIHVKVGFHYTSSQNDLKVVKKIRQYGFKPSTSNRYFGDGVYVAENPFAFSTYGNIGILVLYLAGTIQNVACFDPEERGDDVDSVRGNKRTKQYSGSRAFNFSRSPYFDEIVLRSSEQVLPVFAYPRAAVNNADQLHRFHAYVQDIVDRTINYPKDYTIQKQNPFFLPRKTVLNRVYPSYEDLKQEHALYKAHRKRYEERPRVVFLPSGMIVDFGVPDCLLSIMEW